MQSQYGLVRSSQNEPTKAYMLLRKSKSTSNEQTKVKNKIKIHLKTTCDTKILSPIVHLMHVHINY